MTEVFSLHASPDFKWQVVIHVQQGIRQGDILATIAILVANKGESQRNKLPCIVATPVSEVRVDHDGSEGSRAESDCPLLVPEHGQSIAV